MPSSLRVPFFASLLLLTATLAATAPASATTVCGPPVTGVCATVTPSTTACDPLVPLAGCYVKLTVGTTPGVATSTTAGASCPPFNGDPNWSGYWCHATAGGVSVYPLVEFGTGPQTGVRTCQFDVSMYCVNVLTVTSGGTRCAWVVVEAAWMNLGPGSLACVS